MRNLNAKYQISRSEFLFAALHIKIPQNIEMIT